MARKGAETRQHIIEQAAPVFNKYGFGNTSMSQVMEATDLQKGGIYRHFESKEELACAVFDYTYQLVEKVRFPETEEAARLSASEKLQKFIHEFATVRVGIPGGCPIFNTAVENDDGNPALKKKARAAYQKWIDTIADLAQDAIKDGDLKTAMSAEAFAHFILCSLEGALIAMNLTGQKEILLNQSQALLSLFKTAPSTRKAR